MRWSPASLLGARLSGSGSAQVRLLLPLRLLLRLVSASFAAVAVVMVVVRLVCVWCARERRVLAVAWWRCTSTCPASV